MRQVLFSGLMILGVLFTVLYTNQDHGAISASRMSATEIKKEQEVWVVARNNVDQLLKKTQNLNNIRMLEEKL